MCFCNVSEVFGALNQKDPKLEVVVKEIILHHIISWYFN